MRFSPVRILTLSLALLVFVPANGYAGANADPAANPGGKPDACEFVRGPVFKLLDDWVKTCGHPLCGQIYVAEASRLRPEAEKCEAKAWMSMRDDIRDAVVSGGAVLYGEVHDNPLHHELRSRLGLSNYASSVFEQISVDRAEALAEFVKQYGRNYNSDSLANFKTAVAWDSSGWEKYKYDELLLSMLRAQKPVYAGDASRETVKSVAKSGLTVIAGGEQTRLKVDAPLGETLDAAMLDDLDAAHCKAVPREALVNMAAAQRFRDATLADNVLTAIGKHGSAVLFAGNEHVRKDRGMPVYFARRAPEKKLLSIMLIEVEEGKTDPAAYVPKGPDGKPAADYVIFTPRAEHEDHCAAMKDGKQG